MQHQLHVFWQHTHTGRFSCKSFVAPDKHPHASRRTVRLITFRHSQDTHTHKNGVAMKPVRIQMLPSIAFPCSPYILNAVSISPSSVIRLNHKLPCTANLTRSDFMSIF
jgi:hypothetical protein